jgi:TM2 domain-containing membrane protein YozV
MPQGAPSSPQDHQTPVNHHPEAKDRVAYVLLAVLIGFGIHNFYAGYTNRGLIQLLVSILSCGILWIFMWIWGIIEACTVTQDANGVRFK